MKKWFTPEEQPLADYLLGRLPEPERLELADRILADDEFHECLLAMEELLIDGHARGELDEAEARMVEVTLLATPSGRLRWRTARALAARERREARSRTRRLWLSAAALLVTCGLAFELGFTRHAPEAPSPTPATLLVLPGGVYRDSPVKALALPSGAGAVRFSIPLASADRAPEYLVLMRTPLLGERTLAARGVGPYAQFVVERRDLPPGRYEFELYAVDAGERRLLAYTPVDLR